MVCVRSALHLYASLHVEEMDWSYQVEHPRLPCAVLRIPEGVAALMIRMLGEVTATRLGIRQFRRSKRRQYRAEEAR